jgi:hypothetical protein
MLKQSLFSCFSLLGFAVLLSCGSAALWASPLYAKESPMPEYCEPRNYRDFLAYFVRGYDDQKQEMRDAYTWEQIEIRNYEQSEQLLAATRQKAYRAFRLGLDHDAIYIDRQNPHFYDQPEITISHRKPGDPPIGYVDLMDLKGLKPDPFVLRLQARQYAKLAFRDVTPHSFRVDYADVQYLNSPYAKPGINWIETSEVHGAYVFEHRNGCWYLTQDLRVPRR